MSKKTVKSLVIGILILLCLTAISGCDMIESIMATKYDVNWSVEFDREPCDGAKITVEGYETLPTKIPAGEEITVSIEGINGYKVHRIKVNNRKVLPNDEGKYVFSVTEKTDVEITVREKVASVSVPELDLYAGDEIDRKEVSVKILYETGREELTNKYSVIYQSEDSEGFMLGDDHYFVKLSVDRDNIYRVDLKSPICCQGVIDPHGAVISQDYIDGLKANTDISNLVIGDNGVLSFTFDKPLTSAILLPTEQQMSKGDGDDFSFKGWTTEILAGTDSSFNAKAVYETNLASVTDVKLEVRTVDGVEIPYLVINGNYEAAKSLYLYINNADGSLESIGDSIGGDAVQRGDAFELLFDLRKLAKDDYVGETLNLSFRSEINGIVEIQDLQISKLADNIDLESFVMLSGYKYGFKSEDGLLKIVVSEYFYHGFTISGSVNEDGEVILTISGTVVTKYVGNAVKLDIEYDINGGHKTVETQYCVINEKGEYTVSMNLFNIPAGCNAYIHFWIIDSIEEENIIFVGKENNLLNEWCENTDLDSAYNGIGLITDSGIRCPNSDETRTYFVGKGKWGGLVIYGKNDTEFSYSTNSAEIYIEEERVKIAVIGSYRGTKAEMEAEIALWGYDLMENPYAASDGSSWNGGWTSHTPPYVATVGDDGTFKFVFDVTEIQWVNTHAKACYTFHLGRSGEGADNNANPDLRLSGELGNSSVTYDGRTFTIVSVKGADDNGAKFWGCLGLTIV